MRTGNAPFLFFPGIPLRLFSEAVRFFTNSAFTPLSGDLVYRMAQVRAPRGKKGRDEDMISTDAVIVTPGQGETYVVLGVSFTCIVTAAQTSSIAKHVFDALPVTRLNLLFYLFPDQPLVIFQP